MGGGVGDGGGDAVVRERLDDRLHASGRAPIRVSTNSNRPDIRRMILIWLAHHTRPPAICSTCRQTMLASWYTDSIIRWRSYCGDPRSFSPDESSVSRSRWTLHRDKMLLCHSYPMVPSRMAGRPSIYH